MMQPPPPTVQNRLILSGKQQPLLRIADLDHSDLQTLVDITCDFFHSRENYRSLLRDKKVGMLFLAPSTRTRVAFWSAAQDLGCQTIDLNGTSMQTVTGEAWKDTAMILGCYLDALIVRTTDEYADLVTLTRRIPATINALTHHDHPTQALADFAALREHFGSVSGLVIAYTGCVNNTARSLVWLLARFANAKVLVYAPRGYGFTESEIEKINDTSCGGSVTQFDRIPHPTEPVDVVYTTRWNSMQTARTDTKWLKHFQEYQISEASLSRFGAHPNTVFMHDLPAVRGQEVSDAVLDGDAIESLVTRQAVFKVASAAASLLWSFGYRSIQPKY